MARIEDLLDEIADPVLRQQIVHQVKILKSTKRFGLVFEDHVPETVSLHGLPIRADSIVQNRRVPEDATRLQVLSIRGDSVTIAPVGFEEEIQAVDQADLLVVKAFEEPIFPGLTPVGKVSRASEDRPSHTVINGENFHALQLLAYTHAEKIDVIYIDPPYNTGARDWKYNNRFVDSNDAYRHSKWLAMMERRLKLAKKLLRPDDSVLIVAIDEKEYLRLGLLLEQTFPEADIQMVSSVINTSGAVRAAGFARVDEYLFFVFLGTAAVIRNEQDMLTEDVSTKRPTLWRNLLRDSGSTNRRQDRWRQFYPIFVDLEQRRIVSAGEPLPLGVERDSVQAKAGCVAVFPLRVDGTECYWQLGQATFEKYLTKGYVRVGRVRDGRVSLNYLRRGDIERVESGKIKTIGRKASGELELDPSSYVRTQVPKSVWNLPSHSAPIHGSGVLRRMIPGRQFPYPKSLYAVADTLRFFVSNKPKALILDFFTGSATTLHAAAMLNARDGGSRQCILVTNNDVSDADGRRLNRAGHFTGDPEFEAEGIFESVTKPRIEAAITGVTPDGKPVDGSYLDQYLPEHTFNDGFEENVAFFRMDYLDPDLLELGRQFKAVAPLLWMAAGSVGSWEEWDGRQPWSAPGSSTYAVLFEMAEAAGFAGMVAGRPEITHTWVVTDSHAAFVEVRQELPNEVQASQLYREYLRNFILNAPGVVD